MFPKLSCDQESNRQKGHHQVPRALLWHPLEACLDYRPHEHISLPQSGDDIIPIFQMGRLSLRLSKSLWVIDLLAWDLAPGWPSLGSCVSPHPCLVPRP